MSMRKRRKDGSAFPPLDPVAANGLLERRAHQRRRRAADEWSMEPGARRSYPAVWPAVKIRAEGGAHAEQSEARTPGQRGADATPSPQRHDHTEWPAFRDCPWRRNRDRPRQASPGDPRAGEAADGLHARYAASLPDGIAHLVRGMRW